jgi:hypothetical protein
MHDLNIIIFCFEDLIKNTEEIPNFLNIVIVLWGKKKPSKQLALQTLYFYLGVKDETNLQVSFKIQYLTFFQDLFCFFLFDFRVACLNFLLHRKVLIRRRFY